MISSAYIRTEKGFNLEAMNDNIIVRLPKIEQEKNTDSGIFLGRVNQDMVKSDTGIVVAVGEGRLTADGKLIPLRINVGDKIFFNKFAGTEISGTDNERYIIIKITDVLVRIK